LDWQSSALQSKIKGRGGRRFLAPIHVQEEDLRALGCQDLGDFSLTLNTPVSSLLPKEEAHHAVSVLRLQENELVSIFDTEQQIEGLGFLKIPIDKTSVAAEIHYIRKKRTIYPSLLVGLPKQKTAEALTQKACEVGVSNIFFFVADHSISKT
jgi:RsmE family RNA methyltransferase